VLKQRMWTRYKSARRGNYANSLHRAYGRPKMVLHGCLMFLILGRVARMGAISEFASPIPGITEQRRDTGETWREAAGSTCRKNRQARLARRATSWGAICSGADRCGMMDLVFSPPNPAAGRGSGRGGLHGGTLRMLERRRRPDNTEAPREKGVLQALGGGFRRGRQDRLLRRVWES